MKTEIYFFKKLFISFLLTIFLTGSLRSQTYTFTGAGDGTTWTDANNWSGATGIPYLDDATCNVSVAAGLSVTVPQSTTLLIESGTISGAGKIINKGTINVETTSSKIITIANFENQSVFNLGTGTDNAGYISLYNNTVFENTASGQIIANGLHLSSSGGQTVKNLGVFRKLGSFSESFNISLENAGEIDVQEGTLILNGSNKLNNSVFNIAENAVLESSGTSTLSGIWTGTVEGIFYLNGSNTVASNTVVQNQLSGDGITFTIGTYTGTGTFINESEFTVETTSSKIFTLGKFENKGVFNLGTGTDNAGYISLYNNTVFENTASGEIIANGLHLSSSGGQTVKNLGVFRKLGSFSESFNISLENAGEIDVQEGTLILNGSNKLNNSVFNIAENAVLESSGTSTLSGIWTGTVEGIFYLNGSNTVASNTVVQNQLSGDGITFTIGTYTGTGTFINESEFTVETTSSKIFTLGKFENKGVFNLGTGTDNAGYISLYNNTVFENTASGEIIANGLHFSSSGGQTINNNGIIRKLGSFDETFNTTFNNSGNIIGEEGRIIFSGVLNNTSTGKLSGYKMGTPNGNNFTNNGIFSPGMSPGILDVSGQLKITNGTLEVDLNGLTPGSEFDQLNYSGTVAANLSGNIIINLGFEPAVGDEFIILKSPSATLTSTLAAPGSVIYNGNVYTFLVINNSNEVKLTVFEKTLATNENNLTKGKIYPNPVGDVLHYSLNSDIVSFEVFSISGQKVKSGKNLPSIGTINLQTLSPGNYIIKINHLKGTDSYRLIKK